MITRDSCERVEQLGQSTPSKTRGRCAPLGIAFAAFVAVSTLGCATSVKEVVAPDGSSGFAIECRKNHAGCLERAGELCPSGYALLGSNGAQGQVREDVITPNLIADGNLYISCRDPNSDTSVAHAERTVDAPGADSDRPESPTGAAGIPFGASVEQARTSCEQSGHAWSMNSEAGSCSGSIEDVGMPTTTRVQFCGGAACGVIVQVALDANWAKSIGALRERLADRYGKPTQATLDLSTRCASDAKECAQSKASRVEFTWLWADGHFVRMRMSENRRQLNILYAAPNLEKKIASTGL